MSDEIIHIAQFGTYDIESMGDSMFPKMFYWGISNYCKCKVDIFSLNSNDTPYNGNAHVYAFDEFEDMRKSNHYSFIVIGGGEFVHFKPIYFKDTTYPKGYLWKRPIEMASGLDIPIVINCVGVTEDFDQDEAKEIFSYFSKASCIALRDKYSYERIIRTGVDPQKVKCEPDNNWLFNLAYPEKILEQKRIELAESFNSYCNDEEYFVVQYGTSRDIKILADQILSIIEQQNTKVYLMPINYCHYDLEFLRQLNGLIGNSKAILIDEHLEPVDMLAIIAGAKLFVGTSLHGNLAAASYGVKTIGIDMYPNVVGKMDGLFEMMGCMQYLIPNAEGLAGAARDILQDSAWIEFTNNRVKLLNEQLLEYFRDIVKEFELK